MKLKSFSFLIFNKKENFKFNLQKLYRKSKLSYKEHLEKISNDVRLADGWVHVNIVYKLQVAFFADI